MTVSVLNLRPGDPQGEPKEPTGDPERAGRGARELTGGACRGQKEYQEQPKSPGRAQRRNKTINEPRVPQQHKHTHTYTHMHTHRHANTQPYMQTHKHT